MPDTPAMYIPRSVWVGGGLIAVAVLIGLLFWWLWLPSQLGEGGETLLKVANQTGESVTVVQVGDDGVRTEVAQIQPHITIETVLACASEELVALDRQGAEIARRSASEGCNLKTWVVRSDRS
jgi:hypothetical protein